LQLIYNRDLTSQKAIDEFLNPDWGEDVHDPFLFRDMGKAVDRIGRAIKDKDLIVVYGDYDADGVTGSVILKTTLEALGAKVDVYLPHREKEGYGLSDPALIFLKEKGAKLVLTCDCGVSNLLEIDKALKAGIEVIITDHHRVPKELPEAYAIIHPLLPDEQYPCKYLTGGAVAFKLAQGLLRAPWANECFTAKGGPPVGFEKWLLDLVALSLVADVGKLIGENRTLLKYGLIVLNKTRRPGLRKLCEVSSIKIGSLTASNIAWQITPRINAAGRMDHANAAFALLTEQDPEKAQAMALNLNQANTERQKITEAIIKEANVLIEAGGEKPIYLLYKEGWNPGVIGLSASRLIEKYGRPVILATNNHKGEIVASSRSIDQFNIVEAFEVCQEFLIRFGGHPRAAGFTIKQEQWEPFKQRMESLAQLALTKEELTPQLNLDLELNLDEVNWDLWRDLELLAPYGAGNPEPRFLLKNLEVHETCVCGNNGQHLRLMVLSPKGVLKKLIGFSFADTDRHETNWCKTLVKGTRLDAAVEVGVNEWNGNSELQLKVVDLRLAF
jgi:single-stranded-DNA-specific exonuclease